MPFVQRNEQGEVIAVSATGGPGFDEELASDDLEITTFIATMGDSESLLSASDLDLVRVLEDVVELLISKGVILFTELPESAQGKILRRQQLRTEIGANLDLIGDD